MNAKYESLKTSYLEGFDVHKSLKESIALFDGKDPVDAYYDCKALLDLMRVRLVGLGLGATP